MREPVLNMSLSELLIKYIYIKDFFAAMSLDVPDDRNKNIKTIFEQMDDVELEQKGINKESLEEEFLIFLNNMMLHKRNEVNIVKSITIIGGQNKSGEPENTSITLNRGDVVSIVGPTGSGKSRLLGDIEYLAQCDTPTKRQIMINGELPKEEWRFSIEHKLVAQLSQNMNFVMDLTVGEFIKMHAESRMIDNIEEKQKMIIEEANMLAGEPLEYNTPITSLSGGQSRALMIADTAYLSTSPIVLIDEIENAGIDRKTAIELLMKNEKIILIATHDPVLALRAQRRIVIKNGGISKIHYTTDKEKTCLDELEELNMKLMSYRERLRKGEILNE